MRKILVTEWVSLDGFTAGANGEMDWITAGEDNGEYQNEVVTQADTLLLGRTTYESFAGAWPQRAKDPNTDPGERAFAQRLCDMRKVVISQSLPTVEWENSTLLREIDPAEILKLKQEPGKDIAIYGSASIVRALTDLGLIDEYQLTVHLSVDGPSRRSGQWQGPLRRHPAARELEADQEQSVALRGGQALLRVCW